jgi:hypothetical protein
VKQTYGGFDKENIKDIEKLINSYDAIIICPGADRKHLLSAFGDALKKRPANVILLTTDQTETDTSIMHVSDAFMSGLLDCYYLYEFTDKIIVLSDDLFCPSIKSYVSQGILTEEELINSILC